jgi:hypothetical protein
MGMKWLLAFKRTTIFLTLYIGVVWTLAIVIMMQWANPFYTANLIFSLVYSYLAIRLGRWLFGRKTL